MATNVFRDTARQLEEYAVQHPSVLVLYSGGKDSLVVLDMCSKIFHHVTCVFFYFIPGMECDRKQFAFARDRYGVTVLEYPSFVMLCCLKDGTYCNPHYSFDKLPDMGPFRMADIAAAEYGATLLLTGMKDTDGFARRVCLSRTDNRRDNLIHPIRKWNKYEVLAYLKSNQIPIPISSGQVMSGTGLLPTALMFLHDTYPDDFEKLCRWFPYARAAIYRRQWYGIPDVRYEPQTQPSAA